MKYAKDYGPIVKRLRELGHQVRPVRNGHNVVVSADGKIKVSMPTSPSDRRGLLNFRSELRRRGMLDG